MDFRGRRDTRAGVCSVCRVKKDGQVVPKVHRDGMCPYDRMPTSCGVNKKVGSDTVIFNITAASYCPSLASTRQKFFGRDEVESMAKGVKGRTASLPMWLDRTSDRQLTGWDMWVVSRDVKTDEGKIVKNETRYTSERLARESDEAQHPGAVVRRQKDIDMCEVGRRNCYAVNTEKLRPNTLFFRIRQEFMWDALTPREIADDLELALDQHYDDARTTIAQGDYFTKKVKSITGHGVVWRDRFVTHPYVLVNRQAGAATNPHRSKGFVEVRQNSSGVFKYRLPDGRVISSPRGEFPPEVADIVVYKNKKGQSVVGCVRTDPKAKPRFIRFSESGDVRSQADVDKLAEVFAYIQIDRPDVRVYGYTARRDLDWSKMPSNTVVNGSGCLKDFQKSGVHNSFIATFVHKDNVLYCREDCRLCGISDRVGDDEYRRWFAKHGAPLKIGTRYFNKYCAIPHGRPVYIHFHGAGSKSKVEAHDAEG